MTLIVIRVLKQVTFTETLLAGPSLDLRKPFSGFISFLPSLSLFSDFRRMRKAVCHDVDFLSDNDKYSSVFERANSQVQDYKY